MLHLRCGDDILPSLRLAGLPGDVAKWADPVCEGPLQRWPDDGGGARRAARAAWLAARYHQPEEQVLRDLEAQDRALEAAGRHDEVVLWFEHDLFDQAILIFLLSRLARLPRLAPGATSLICVDSFPGVVDFVGLGQLSAAQLSDLFPTRRPVQEAQFRLADRAWAALVAGDPEGIWELTQEDRSPLPFLGPALRRYLAELPSSRTGLSQSEFLALQAVAAGADTPGHAFVAAQRFETAPWQGDTMFFATLGQLTAGPAPLLAARSSPLPPPRVSDPAFRSTPLEVTQQGRAVLSGRLDWCQVGNRSWWLGGIPLADPEPAWRWNERAERPVRSGP